MGAHHASVRRIRHTCRTFYCLLGFFVTLPSGCTLRQGELSRRRDEVVQSVGGQSPRFVAVSAGPQHTCALRSDGSARCWGNNDAGQLGIGSTHPSMTPTPVAHGSSLREIAAGDHHTCALREGGTVVCWGMIPVSHEGPPRHLTATPLSLGDVRDARAISSGTYHSCVITEGHRALCWGASNLLGERGNRPSGVGLWTWDGADNAETVRARVGVTCILTRAGTVRCAGTNSHMQLGVSDLPYSTELLEVHDLRNVVEIAVGVATTCARIADGSVVCWGGNEQGQCADGTTVDRLTPNRVPGIGRAIGISVGRSHACAVTAARSVFCWGSWLNGRRGVEPIEGVTPVSPPTRVRGLDEVSVISAGWDHTCALKLDGSIWCWGVGADGQLGNGARADRAQPTPVAM